MSGILDDDMRLQLAKMIAANDCEDQTPLIRQLKHSYKLQEEINTLLRTKHEKKQEGWTDADIHSQCSVDCFFLFTYYTDLFNKIIKNEIDLKILNHFLNVLRQIEEGEVDQHEGSFIVGTLLKELYIDSALKKADKLNAAAMVSNENGDGDDNNSKPIAREVKPVSWSQFKYRGEGV